jgi:hypothetical protein
MSEANLARRGGGINLGNSTTPASVQVFHPDRAKRVSGRGVFDGGSLHFNMLIFNELQRRHYKRSEGSPFFIFHS